jgi:MtrB/PioB family decaheme-associated outer membrane protein
MKRTVTTIALALLVSLPLAAQTGQNPPDPPVATQSQDEPESQQGTPPSTPDESSQANEAAAITAEGETPATSVHAEVGVQGYENDTDSAKFEEYRDLQDGFAIPLIQILVGSGFSLTAEDVGEDDQRYLLGWESGELKVNAFFDEIPHRYGNNGRYIFNRTRSRAWELSDTIQASNQAALQAQFAANPNGINFDFLNNLIRPTINASDVVDVEMRRQRMGAEVGYSFGDIGVDVSYFSEARRGERLAGTSFGFGMVTETLEPVDHLTTDISAAATVPLGGGFLRGVLGVNRFNNHIPWYTWDNPFRLTDSTDPGAYQAPGRASIGGSSRGRTDTPPDNDALRATLAYFTNLPLRSRVAADVTLGRWTQDQQFSPYTVNSAITVPFDATNPANLPEQSLDGQINTLSGNFSFNSRPIENLGLNARYRLYDLDNETDRITFPGYVRFDGAWQGTRRISVPYSWTNNRLDLSATYDLGRIATLEAGYRWDQMDRTFRETEETTENVILLAADVRPFSWGLFRAAIEKGDRDYDHYDYAHSEHASFVDEVAATNLPSLRRYDQAKRDFDRVSAILQLTPFGNLAGSLHFYRMESDYDESEHGLIESSENAATAEIDYTPNDRWNVYAFYTISELQSFQRGRQSGATPSTNPLDDWTAEIDNDENAWGFGGNGSFVADRLKVKTYVRQQKNEGFNDLDSPPGGTPDFAVDIALFDDVTLLTISAEAQWRLREAWSLALGGFVEDYDIDDAAQQNVSNFVPGGIFIAPNDSDYDGKVLYLRAIYRR